MWPYRIERRGCMVVLDLSKSKIMTCGLEATESNPNTHVWRNGNRAGVVVHPSLQILCHILIVRTQRNTTNIK
jgi:hypothetical protein